MNDEEPKVLGRKDWTDTMTLQIVEAAYEILKVGGDLDPEAVAKMTVQELLEAITPNKLRLKLEPSE